ncbi:SNF2-related protein [Longimicrobium sp.]|jgi:adenine-specific DNA-methyltransferase|uniref:SNF2-related protein n=1 Tax=Longimicrobium sp. TaxID=2029185 RepID=UPI002ED9BC6B
MQFTDYHARLFAQELKQRHAPDVIEKLAGTVAAAQVQLNPHQVEAALFAFQSPLSKGALLADEVGLGKTIEAGLVISQRWAERKRKILIIVPANLRKQWSQELAEKFFLPSIILESRSFNAISGTGNVHPFRQKEAVVICSYQFARAKAEAVAAVQWDLVVIDEAHRLRNVYKPSNQIANTLKQALAGRNKLLLTATPLQNSLLELYGLVSFIDEHAFGDVKSFREQFGNLSQEQAFRSLRERLRPLCHRTLRRQVTAYVSFTQRLPLLEEFTPDEVEDQLYTLVSDYLARENLQALPASQRTLITLVLRKLLASSTFAIAGALAKMSQRLKARLAEFALAGVALTDGGGFEAELEADYEALDETAEEWSADADDAPLTHASRAAIEAEIRELDSFTSLAVSIEQNAKGRKLLDTLGEAFRVAAERGGPRKAIIFTESRRTQDYLLGILSDSPFADGIVLFNGSNTDERSRKIYADWLVRHQGTDRVSGSRTADMRSALVDYFRSEEGQIMIATEAGAEGINLQFCSLVINYDLPWNPQRIEQRIGRCHRYGQRHDVVVVNFLNRNNAADRRVFELLDEKFQLFKGVFGSSDEVLGALESGVDFEKRIAAIYQRCRTPEEIQAAFDQLQRELSTEINEAMSSTRRKLLENFDEEVVEKLQAAKEKSEHWRSRFEELLMDLTRYELGGRAEFVSEAAFRLVSLPDGVRVPLGLYELPRRSGDAHTYRLGHELADHVLERALCRDLPVREVSFDYSGSPSKVTLLESLVGRRGWLSFSLSTVEALDQAEDRLVFAGFRDDGVVLEDDAVRRMFGCAAAVGTAPAADAPGALAVLAEERHAAHQRDVSLRNAQAFEAEAAKLDAWADDLKVGLEREIKEIDRQIKEARRAATAALTLEEKLAGQRRVKELEGQRNAKRRSLFDAQDQIEAQRETLISEIEGRLVQSATLATQFVLRWEVC